MNLTMFTATELLRGQRLHMIYAKRKLLSVKEGYTDGDDSSTDSNSNPKSSVLIRMQFVAKAF